MKWCLPVTILVCFITSCKKDRRSETTVFVSSPISQRAVTATCNDPVEPADDTTGTNTRILSAPLRLNPYSIAVMKQAALQLYGPDKSIIPSHLYVRYKPTSYEAVERLALDTATELFDHPLDQEVLTEGLQTNSADIPSFYTVVTPDYIPLPGIPFEVIEPVYIPSHDLLLEEIAFTIAGVREEESCSGRLAQEPGCPDPANPDCDYGGSSGGTGIDIRKPAGLVTVFDTNKGLAVPVRKVKVVARRYLKIEVMHTDDEGRFASSKRFNGKVTMLVKFQSEGLIVRGLQSAAFWQMFFPIKKNAGRFSGNLSNLQIHFDSDHQGRGSANRNWWAAQFVNSYHEYDEVSAQLQTGSKPKKLVALLSSWGSAAGMGSTPMNGHRLTASSFPAALVHAFIADPSAGSFLSALLNFLYNGIFTQSIDLTMGYHTEHSSGAWNSDRVKANIYHELAHAAHFKKVGEWWWNDLVAAESTTALAHLGSAASPYGHGNDGHASAIIALAEGWADYTGRTMADKRYGMQSAPFQCGGQLFANNAPLHGYSSHGAYLETFDPDYGGYLFRWIPSGLFLDLVDDRNEILPVVDAVSGYTDAQLFNALDSDVSSMAQYRERLLSENNQHAQANVTTLFGAYHY